MCRRATRSAVQPSGRVRAEQRGATCGCHSAGEGHVRPRERLADRDAVQHGQCLHRPGCVHCQAHRHVAAPVVAHQREPIVPQPAHQDHKVSGHRPFRVRRMVGGHRRFRRPPVPTQVRADDGVTGRDEPGRDAVPRGVRARMPVQQQHRQPVPTAAAVQHNAVPDLTVPLTEPLEHSSITPAPRFWCRTAGRGVASHCSSAAVTPLVTAGSGNCGVLVGRPGPR
jgi:hypothetical protein